MMHYPLSYNSTSNPKKTLNKLHIVYYIFFSIVHNISYVSIQAIQKPTHNNFLIFINTSFNHSHL
jgi:hypothetical protein